MAEQERQAKLEDARRKLGLLAPVELRLFEAALDWMLSQSGACEPAARPVSFVPKRGKR